MNQGTRTSQTSQSEQTKCYFDMAAKIERTYSFEQRVVLKIISENPNIFAIVQEVPYNISQIMNKSYLIENQPIIGYGSFGTVFFCWHIIGKMFCAVKVHQRCQSEEILQQVNEFKILDLLNTKFPQSSLFLIDRVYILQESLNYFTTYAGMEIATTTLSEYIAKVDIKYHEFLSIYHCLLQQILEMHSLRIAHRDIKLSNIVYTFNKGWLFSDFGCAQFYQNQKGKYQIQGTRQYLPPNLRVLVKNNVSQIECEQNLFDNDIYSFLFSMLQIYKKELSILQVQNMLDVDCLLKQLPREFQIYGKSYNYIKLNILIGLNKVPLQQQFETEKNKQIDLILREKRQNLDYVIELIIKQKKIFDFSFHVLWQTYQLRPRDTNNSYYYIGSKPQVNEEEVNKIYSQYDDFLLDEFQQIEDKQLLKINSDMKPWQYNLLQMYYLRLGNIQKQYNACLEMQKYAEESKINYKLQEIECLIELDQLETAHQILEELQLTINQITKDQTFCNIKRIQYLLDDISYVKLELLRIYLEKSWLETANEFQKYFFKLQILLQHSILFPKIQNNIYWIFSQFNYKLDEFMINFDLNEPLEVTFQRALKNLGITTSVPKDLIKQLQQRGADKFGIRFILLILIQITIYSMTFNDNILVDELFEQTIQFYEQNNLLHYWEIYYYYSIYCQKKLQFQKSLSLILKALQFVDKNNNLYTLQVLFQQMYCEINLYQCQEYLNTLMQILILVRQIQSDQCRLYLIKRIVGMLSQMFQKQQSTSQAFIIIQLYLQSETNTEILSILYQLEWETVLISRNPISLINLFNEKMLKICDNSNLNDKEMLKCFQNITFAIRQTLKTNQNIENQKLVIGYTAKYIQNLIIFEDIFNFNQTETLNIKNELLRYTYMNQQLRDEEQVNEALTIIQDYSFNNYQEFKGFE